MNQIILYSFTFLLLLMLSACVTKSNVQEKQNIQDKPIKKRIDPHQWEKSLVQSMQQFSIGNLPKQPLLKNNFLVGNKDAINFGYQLFFDKRFSANGKVACATCHKPALYFTDGLRRSLGVASVKRNAPTIVGVSYSNWFFVDGRADSLWSQALGPMENELEHGGNRMQYAHAIYHDLKLKGQYESLFGKFPDLHDKGRFPNFIGPFSAEMKKNVWDKMREVDRQAITKIFVNIGKAIASYETLLKPGSSRFDDYVKAAKLQDIKKMKELFTNDEAKGLRIFLTKGMCIICHSGPLFSDFGFHNIGTPPESTRNLDWGRYTGANSVLKSPFNCFSQYNDDPKKYCDELKYIVKEKDHTIGAFKTPMLRNVSKTAPYMHAGQYETLFDVIKHYADPPTTKIGKSDLLDIELNDQEILQLEKFLHTLDSEINSESKYLSAP